MKTSYHNIRVDRSAKDKIRLLAKRNEKSETEFASQMIFFVYKNGLDIYTQITPSVPDLIKNLDKRIVSFLKKREQDFFVPMEKSFREMIALHTRTFDALEVLNPVDLEQQKKLVSTPQKEADKKLLIPADDKLEKLAENVMELTDSKAQNPALANDEKEGFLDQIERLEIERNTYLQELQFLLDNIKPGKTLTAAKFVCNLSSKELDRIKNLIRDNQDT